MKILKSDWAIILILITCIIFFYPVWLKGKVPLPVDALVSVHVPWTEVAWKGYPTGVPIKNLELTDSISQFYPWRSLVGNFWRAYQVPLWNFYSFNGSPFLATLHSASFYPLNALYLLFSNIRTWEILIFLQIFLSAFFTYLFLRELRVLKLSSLIGSITFAFSGYMIAWLEFATGGQAGIWLPLLLLLEIKIIKSERTIWILPIPFVFLMIFTAGDFQVPLYITVLFFALAIFLSRKLSILFKVLLSFLLGVLLAAPQILPSIELFRSSIRLNDPYIASYNFGLMDWQKIVHFIWPDFFGNIVTRNYWGRFGFHEYISFCGVVALSFCLYSIFTKKVSIEKFFLGVLIVSLIFLFPTPIAYLPYKFQIPGLGTSSASRIIFIIGFCVAILASFGFDKWLKKADRKFLLIVASLLFITAGVALWLLFQIKFGYVPAQTVQNYGVALRNMIPATLILILLFFAQLFRRFSVRAVSLLIILAVIAEMLRFGWKNTVFADGAFLYPETKTLSQLKQLSANSRVVGVPPNLLIPYAIFSAEGYDSMYPLENSNWYAFLNNGSFGLETGRYGLISNYSSNLLNFANVCYVVDYLKDQSGQVSVLGNYNKALISPRYTKVFTEYRASIFKNNNCLPYVWMSQNTTVQPDQTKEMLLLEKPESSANRLIVFESPPDNLSLENNLSYEIKNVYREYNSVKISLSSTENAYLFLSESYSPDWQAYVDGKSTGIYKVNYLFQSIFVPKGEHTIVFDYKPKSFENGVILSALSLAVLVGIGLLRKKV